MDWLKTLRIGIYIGLFSMPFLALVVANGLYFPFITGKNFAFRIIIEVVFALWVILALYAPEYRPKKSLALILGGLFVVSIGISTVLAENPTKAFWSNFERMEGYITILHLAMYTTVMVSVMKTETLWRRFFNGSLIASAIIALYALMQLWGVFNISQSAVRLDATFGNATYFAVFMLIHSFIALYALARWAGQNRWLQVGYATLFVVNGLLVFYSSTRGSILGLIGGLVLAGLIAAIMGGGKFRIAGITLVAFILVLTGIFYSVRDTDIVRTHPVLERLASISIDAGRTRFTIWGMAYQGFLERPVFGWGQEGFNHLFSKYYVPKLYTQEPWFDRAHNVILDWLVAGGLVGMVLYISLYLVMLYYLWRPGGQFETSERAILTGLIAGYGFHNIFVFDNLMSYVLFLALFTYITVRATRDAPEPTGTPLPESSAQVAVPAVIGILAVVMYFFNYAGYASASDIIQGLTPHPEGVTKNAEYFERAAKRTGLGYQEVGEQYLQFALQMRGRNIGDQEFQQRVANGAKTTMEGVLSQSPNDARLLVFFGSFLRQYGDAGLSRTYLDRAVAVSPQKQSVLLERGLLSLTEGKYDLALQDFKTVYETAPEFQRTHILYATSAILAKDQALATEILTRHFGNDEPEDATIIQAYVMSKQSAKAIRIAEARVAADPTNVEKLKFLSGVYLQTGDRGGAIRALERAIELDPKFKAEGESYITQIRENKI
jgi:O-antigen ligase/tetratricopeptide (TPR) repeat protein